MASFVTIATADNNHHEAWVNEGIRSCSMDNRSQHLHYHSRPDTARTFPPLTAWCISSAKDDGDDALFIRSRPISSKNRVGRAFSARTGHRSSSLSTIRTSSSGNSIRRPIKPSHRPLHNRPKTISLAARQNAAFIKSTLRQRGYKGKAFTLHNPNIIKMEVGNQASHYRPQIVYEITVQTGSHPSSGTTSNVYVQLTGTKGIMPKTRLTTARGKPIFSKSSTITFRIHSGDIGDLYTLLVETDAFDERDSWFLQEIWVTNLTSGKCWWFPCQQWLSLWRADGQTVRILKPKPPMKAEPRLSTSPVFTDYEVITKTGDSPMAGTTANVFITLFSHNKRSPRIQLSCNHRDCFRSAKVDSFLVTSPVIGQLSRIRIEHDNTGNSPGWFLEKVTIKEVSKPYHLYHFPCYQWLSTEEGDAKIYRDLVVSKYSISDRLVNRYKLTVFTGDVKGAGTDAQVFIVLEGKFGESGEYQLENSRNNFERGRIDEFMFDITYLGPLQKLRIRHDNSGLNPGWFLDKVIVDDVSHGESYEFPCYRWLADYEGDGRIERDLRPRTTIHVPTDVPGSGISYTIRVVTGNVVGAGTTANVYVELFGRSDASGHVWLRGGRFQRARTDVFNVELTADVSPVARLIIGHDNSGTAPSWFLDKVIIYCLTTRIEQTFLCSKWLARNEGDGLISRELYEAKHLRKERDKKICWLVTVYTGNLQGATTDSDVFLVLYGNRGHTDTVRLQSKTGIFERGQVDKFNVDMVDIGTPFKIRLWLTGSGHFNSWFVEKVEMQNMITLQKFFFPCGRWFSKSEEDGHMIRELPAHGTSVLNPLPVVQYYIQVFTGDVLHGGTNANVFICIYGDYGDTGERPLENSKSHLTKFERGMMDEFVIEAVSLGKIKRISVRHDGKRPGTGWFLEKIIIRGNEEELMFWCNRWFAVDEGDGQVERHLLPMGTCYSANIGYVVSVKTGDVWNGGTDAKVFLTLHGERSCTFQLIHSDNHPVPFQRGQLDMFTLKATDVGKINYISISHDNSNRNPDWFLDEVVIQVPSRAETYSFACHRWLATLKEDGLTEITLYPTKTYATTPVLPYSVTVKTGDRLGSGTEAVVYIQMFGPLGRSEVIYLRNRKDNFGKGAIDHFQVEAPDIGKLTKIRVGVDDKGPYPHWFLDYIKISYPRTATVPLMAIANDDVGDIATVIQWFECRRWLAKDEEDGCTERDLLPTLKSLDRQIMKDYKIRVYTGDQLGAATGANVYITMFGSKGDSGGRHLRKSQYRNKFERGQMDEFSLYISDLGSLTKIRIWHDNTGVSPGWFLEKIEIEDSTTAEIYMFPCNKWLCEHEDDGILCRDLPAVSLSQAVDRLHLEAKLTKYIIAVVTGYESIDANTLNPFVEMFGERQVTGKIPLLESQSHKNKFEVNQTDRFIFETVNLGDIKKIRIGHNNTSPFLSWFLDRVIINCPSHGRKWIFPCNQWLSTSKADGLLERILYPTTVCSFEFRPYVVYEILTYTSEMFAFKASNADCFVQIFGKHGSSEKLDLRPSPWKVMFESGTVDKFVFDLEDLGDPIEKLRIGHNDTRLDIGWCLDKVELQKIYQNKCILYSFPCGRWFSRSHDDGQIVRDLVLSRILSNNSKETAVDHRRLQAKNYIVRVFTGDAPGAGTSANVFIDLIGYRGNSVERKLLQSQLHRTKFERNQVDEFSIDSVDLGSIYKIHIRHDTCDFSSAWLLDRVEVIDPTVPETFVFICGRWLSDDSEGGPIAVLYVKDYDKLFHPMSPIHHQAIENVVETESGDSVTTCYRIAITTGPDRDHGTCGNVWIRLTGEENQQTPLLALVPSHNRGFQPDSIEVFSVETLDVGKIYQIQVSRDDNIPGSGWFLKTVEITAVTKYVVYNFACHCWLAGSRDEASTSRIFTISEDQITCLLTTPGAMPLISLGYYAYVQTIERLNMAVTAKNYGIVTRPVYTDLGQGESLQRHLSADF